MGDFRRVHSIFCLNDLEIKAYNPSKGGFELEIHAHNKQTAGVLGDNPVWRAEISNPCYMPQSQFDIQQQLQQQQQQQLTDRNV